MAGVVCDLVIRASAKGSEFFRRAEGSEGPARGRVGEAELNYSMFNLRTFKDG